MRVVNAAGEEIATYDLENGYLIDSVAIRKDAEPIDNVKKFAYADSDYEPVKMYVPIAVDDQIETIKSKLRDTDYIVIKIAEGAATSDEYADIINQRQQWRNQINNLRDKQREGEQP